MAFLPLRLSAERSIIWQKKNLRLLPREFRSAARMKRTLPREPEESSQDFWQQRTASAESLCITREALIRIWPSLPIRLIPSAINGIGNRIQDRRRQTVESRDLHRRSSRGNPDGPGGFGTVLHYTDGKGQLHVKELSAGYRRTTNNRMELMAAIAGWRR